MTAVVKDGGGGTHLFIDLERIAKHVQSGRLTVDGTQSITLPPPKLLLVIAHLLYRHRVPLVCDTCQSMQIVSELSTLISSLCSNIYNALLKTIQL